MLNEHDRPFCIETREKKKKKNTPNFRPIPASKTRASPSKLHPSQAAGFHSLPSPPQKRGKELRAAPSVQDEAVGPRHWVASPRPGYRIGNRPVSHTVRPIATSNSIASCLLALINARSLASARVDEASAHLAFSEDHFIGRPTAPLTASIRRSAPASPDSRELRASSDAECRPPAGSGAPRGYRPKPRRSERHPLSARVRQPRLRVALPKCFGIASR